jgi:hypothetical protein
MSAEENKAVVRRVYTEVMLNDDLSVIPELFADEYVYHSPGSPDVYGPDSFRELVTAYQAAFPDFLQTADLLIAAEGDTVVSRWTSTGCGAAKPAAEHFHVSNLDNDAVKVEFCRPTTPSIGATSCARRTSSACSAGSPRPQAAAPSRPSRSLPGRRMSQASTCSTA